MSDYTPPLRDMRFVLDHLVDLEALAQLESFKHAEPDVVHGVLEESGRFMADVIGPLNRIGDEQGSVWHEDGTVTTPDGFKDAYDQYVAAGWGGVPFPEDYGGGGFPWIVTVAMQEMLTSACMAFSMGPLLTQGGIDMLLHHASEEHKEVYLPKMVSGEWTGTMNLTEPEAGSDVGALRTKAVPQDDGSYLITGTKIFISFGEHDLAENIIHLVLARTPDSPPGTKGISCFIVPKYLVNEDGSLGERNDVRCVSIEHKMGIKASPTCQLSFGDGDGAVGYLIGEEHQGMRYMFTMMNNARLSVGIEGLSLSERAYQQARQYAIERTQGRAVGAEPGTSSPIVEHADVRRMLLTMKAYIEAMRGLMYLEAEAIDLGKHHPDEDVRTKNQELADLLTPIAKGWGTDLGVEVTSLAIQVYGGMGYVEETGVAQHFRDARIAPIYEGTNGIQAMDLVGRKLPMRGGGVVGDFIADLRQVAEEAKGSSDEDLQAIGSRLEEATGVLDEATAWLGTNGMADVNQALGGATPYLRLFGLAAGGWVLAREAVAAKALLDEGGSKHFDEDFLKAKVGTARFYADHLLPAVKGLLDPITSGADDLFALEPSQL